MQAERMNLTLRLKFGIILALVGGIFLLGSEVVAQTCNDNGICEPGLGEECEGGIDNSGNACADCFDLNEEQVGGFQCTAGVSCPITNLCSVDPTTGQGNDEDCVDCNPCTTAICQAEGINGVCVVSQVTCNPTSADLCCPAGCSSSDDADCPSTGGSPNPPDPTNANAVVEGSGCSLHVNSGAHPGNGIWARIRHSVF